MVFAGDVRDRSIYKSVYVFLKNSLETIGWFNAERDHSPIVFQPGRPAQSTIDTISPNTLVLYDKGIETSDFEMGTEAGLNKWTFGIDLYAESEPLGRALVADLRKILAGQYPGVSMYPIIHLYDYSQTPEVYVTYMDVDDIKVTHPTSKELYQRFWFQLEWTLTDYDI